MASAETIYNLLPKEKSRTQKAPVYMSKSRPMVKDETKAPKKDHKTMGFEKTPLRAPGEFVKKHEKEPILPEKKQFTYPDNERAKPAVPKNGDYPPMGLKTTKDFIVNNAVKNITSDPKAPAHIFVDTKIGDKNALDPSGLTPKYVNKKDFGQTPGYITKRKDDMDKAKKEYDAYVEDRFRQRTASVLPEEERQEMLYGLKKNWEMAHHDYQGLSLVTDTEHKRQKKERLEGLMKQLERDIDVLEKHSVIYVA